MIEAVGVDEVTENSVSQLHTQGMYCFGKHKPPTPKKTLLQITRKFIKAEELKTNQKYLLGNEAIKQKLNIQHHL